MVCECACGNWNQIINYEELLCFVVDGAVKKRVEDVMPIATGHEREELEAELEVIFSPPPPPLLENEERKRELCFQSCS